MTRLLVPIALLALGATFTTASLASRKPDHDEAVAITKAFKTTTLAGLNKLAKQFNVVGIRVSTVNPRYARASFVPKPKYRHTFQAGYGVAKLDRTKHWRAFSVGSADVGCPPGGRVVPKPVRKDLKLACH